MSRRPRAIVDPPPGPSTTSAGSDAPVASSGLASLRARVARLEQHGSETGLPVSMQGVVTQLVEDADFRARMREVLGAKLTSTSDGATKETRIRELADMVKQSRKALKDALGRLEQLGNSALQQEGAVAPALQSAYERGRREAAEEGEGRVSDTQAAAQVKALRAEVLQAQAETKRAEAQAAAQIDRLEGSVRSAEREVERHQQEARLAAEFQRKAEAKAAKAEGEARALKKEARDKCREAEAALDAVHRQAADAARAADAEREGLRARLTEAERRGAELEERVRALGQEAADAAQARAELAGRAEALAQSAETQAGAAERLGGELAAARAEAQQAGARAAELAAELDRARAELGEWRGRAEQASASFQQERTRADTERQRAAADLERLGADVDRLSREAAELRGREGSLGAEVQELRQTKERLKASLQEASGELVALGEQLAQAGRTEAGLRDALDKSECERAGQEAARAEAEGRAARAERDAAEAMGELEGVSRRAREAESKLETLECELETLKEVAGGDGDQRDMLNRLVAKVGQLEAAAAENEAKRRDLQNYVLELKGNIRVFCRVRPIEGRGGAIECLPDRTTVRLDQGGRPHPFSFDRVFAPQATQEQVFQEVSELVQSALDGYKVCLFSYGQTGAGKTHTMQGNPNSPAQRGIIPRSVDKILEAADRMERQGWQYKFEASFIEIYNEQLRDLLAPGTRRGAARIEAKDPIKHDAEGGHTVVVGAARHTIGNYEDAQEIIRRANAARATESTAMNAESSRSHSVFMMFITGYHEASQTRLTGVLNLVDLAGSERLDRSQVEGARAKEAISINKSLSSLGDVFASLASKNSHIPYRNSKLTHLLQPCLGGDGKTLMFVNINPEAPSAQESLCSLRFAARVNQCETAARGGAKRAITVAGEELEGAKPKARPGTAPASRVKRTRLH